MNYAGEKFFPLDRVFFNDARYGVCFASGPKALAVEATGIFVSCPNEKAILVSRKCKK